MKQSPRIRCLFGPVGISPGYSAVGRRLIVEVLSRHHAHPELQSLVRPRHPLRHARAGGASQPRLRAGRAFGGTLDGLVFVDVARIPGRALARYSGIEKKSTTDINHTEYRT